MYKTIKFVSHMANAMIIHVYLIYTYVLLYILEKHMLNLDNVIIEK